MSLKYRDSQGTETPVAGLNGISGELVPSVALVQRGTTGAKFVAAGSKADYTVTFTTDMPDTNYQIVVNTSGVNGGITYSVWNKSVTGFNMTAVNNNTTDLSIALNWTAFKLMTDTVHEADATHIAQNTANFAPAFSDVVSYAVGDYVTYNNVLYRCTTAHTAGVWVAGHFTQVTVGNSFTSFPDYAHPISIPNGATSWTATQDCYVDYTYMGSVGNIQNARLTIDGNEVGVYDKNNEGVSTFSGFVKKGQIVSTVIGTTTLSRTDIIKVFPLNP